MTREIKFRAWDKKTKSIISEVFEIGLGSRNNPETWLVGDDRQTNNFELMQFTGLKDKKGKEIYEGDLIKKDHHQEIFEVIFCLKGHFAGSFCLKNRETGNLTGFSQESIWMPSDAPKNFDEVIGNIYENPELLKN